MLESLEREPLLGRNHQDTEQNRSFRFWVGKDSALAWTVAFSIFLINFITIGLGSMSGVLYVDLMRQYNVSRVEASAPFSIQQSTRNLFGSLVGVLGDKFGIRAVTISGGLIGAASSMACAFAEDVTWITVLWGGIYGTSIAFTSSLTQVIIDKYFERHLSSASGFSLSGGPVGAMVFAVAFRRTVDDYGLMNSYIIMGVYILLVLPLAIPLTSPPWSVFGQISSSNEEARVTRGERLMSNLQLSGSCEKQEKLKSSQDEVDAKPSDSEPQPSTSYASDVSKGYRPKERVSEPKNYGSTDFSTVNFAKSRSFNVNELTPRIKLLYTSFFPLDTTDFIDTGVNGERSRVDSEIPPENIPEKEDINIKKTNLLESSKGTISSKKTKYIGESIVADTCTGDKTYVGPPPDDVVMKEEVKLLNTSTLIRSLTDKNSGKFVSIQPGASSCETDISNKEKNKSGIGEGKFIRESKVITETDIGDQGSENALENITKRSLDLLTPSLALSTAPDENVKEVISEMPKDSSGEQIDALSKGESEVVETKTYDYTSRINSQVSVDDKDFEIDCDHNETKINLDLVKTSSLSFDVVTKSGKETDFALSKDSLAKETDVKSKTEGGAKVSRKFVTKRKTVTQTSSEVKDFDVFSEDIKTQKTLNFPETSLTASESGGKILSQLSKDSSITNVDDGNKGDGETVVTKKYTRKTKISTQKSIEDRDYEIASSVDTTKKNVILLDSSLSLPDAMDETVGETVSELSKDSFISGTNVSSKSAGEAYTNKESIRKTKFIKQMSGEDKKYEVSSDHSLMKGRLNLPETSLVLPDYVDESVKKITSDICKVYNVKDIDIGNKSGEATVLVEKYIHKEKVASQTIREGQEHGADLDDSGEKESSSLIESSLSTTSAETDTLMGTLSKQSIESSIKEVALSSKNEKNVDIENYATKSIHVAEISTEDKDYDSVKDEKTLRQLRNPFTFPGSAGQKSERIDPEISSVKSRNVEDSDAKILEDLPDKQGMDASPLTEDEICGTEFKSSASKREISLRETSFVPSDTYFNNFETSSDNIDVNFLRRNEYFVIKIIHNLSDKFILEELENLYQLVEEEDLSFEKATIKFQSKPHEVDYPCVSCGRTVIDSSDADDIEDARVSSEKDSRKSEFYNHLKNLSNQQKSDILPDFDEVSREHVGKVVDEMKKLCTYAEENDLFSSPLKAEIHPHSNNVTCPRCHIPKQVGVVLRLYLNPAFLLISLCRAVHLLTFYGILTIISDFVLGRGLQERVGRYSVAVMLMGDLIGRLCTGWITDYEFIRQERFMWLAMVLTGVISASLPVLPSYFLLICIGTCSFLLGSVFIRHPVLVSKYTKSHERTVGMGFMTLFSGILGFALPVYVGYFRDVIRSYNPIFYINGGIFIFIGFLWLLEPKLQPYIG